MSGLLLAALTWAGPAHADSGMIEAGATVRITALSRRDAFWRFHDDLVGRYCQVLDPGLVQQKKQWYGGPLACDDGETYYFYKVAVAVGDFSAELEGHLAPALPVADPPDPADGVSLDSADGVSLDPADAVVGGVVPAAAASDPTGIAAPSGAAWPDGTPVRVHDVSAADSFREKLATLVTLDCTVSGGDLSPGDPGWFSGNLHCADGNDYFFYQVAVVARGPGASGTPTP